MRAIDKNASIDWVLFIATLPLLAAGLISMRSFGLASDHDFTRQVYWIMFSMFLFFSFSFVDWRIFKKTEVLVVLFLVANFFLMILLVTGKVTKGAASWFDLGLFSIEP